MADREKWQINKVGATFSPENQLSEEGETRKDRVRKHYDFVSFIPFPRSRREFNAHIGFIKPSSHAWPKKLVLYTWYGICHKVLLTWAFLIVKKQKTEGYVYFGEKISQKNFDL